MRPWRRWRVWHKKRSRTYAWANSFWGTLWARRTNNNAADRDLIFSLDRIPMATHEGRGVHEFPGNPDPRRMTWRQVSKLRHRLGFRIRSAARALIQDTDAGVTPFFEIKPDGRTLNPEIWKPLIKVARRRGVRLHLMAQPFTRLQRKGDTYPPGIAALAAAKQAAAELGDVDLVHVTVLTRGKVPAEWWDVLDDAKGPKRHTKSRPENKPARVSGRVA